MNLSETHYFQILIPTFPQRSSIHAGTARRDGRLVQFWCGSRENRGFEWSRCECLRQIVEEASWIHCKAGVQGNLQKFSNCNNFLQVVTMAVPYRHTILKAVALGQEGLDDVCIHHIQCHLDNFRLNVKTLVDYYIAKKLDTPDP